MVAPRVPVFRQCRRCIRTAAPGSDFCCAPCEQAWVHEHERLGQRVPVTPHRIHDHLWVHGMRLNLQNAA